MGQKYFILDEEKSTFEDTFEVQYKDLIDREGYRNIIRSRFPDILNGSYHINVVREKLLFLFQGVFNRNGITNVLVDKATVMLINTVEGLIRSIDTKLKNTRWEFNAPDHIKTADRILYNGTGDIQIQVINQKELFQEVHNELSTLDSLYQLNEYYLYLREVVKFSNAAIKLREFNNESFQNYYHQVKQSLNELTKAIETSTLDNKQKAEEGELNTIIEQLQDSLDTFSNKLSLTESDIKGFQTFNEASKRVLETFIILINFLIRSGQINQLSFLVEKQGVIKLEDLSFSPSEEFLEGISRPVSRKLGIKAANDESTEKVIKLKLSKHTKKVVGILVLSLAASFGYMINNILNKNDKTKNNNTGLMVQIEKEKETTNSRDKLLGVSITCLSHFNKIQKKLSKRDKPSIQDLNTLITLQVRVEKLKEDLYSHKDSFFKNIRETGTYKNINIITEGIQYLIDTELIESKNNDYLNMVAHLKQVKKELSKGFLQSENNRNYYTFTSKTFNQLKQNYINFLDYLNNSSELQEKLFVLEKHNKNLNIVIEFFKEGAYSVCSDMDEASKLALTNPFIKNIIIIKKTI